MLIILITFTAGIKNFTNLKETRFEVVVSQINCYEYICSD